jgi:hypothetical protein
LQDVGVDSRRKLKDYWVVEVLFLGVKRLEREVSPSAPSSVEVKNELSYTHTSRFYFLACVGTNSCLF